MFEARGVTGNPTETEEMAPKWFDENNIPYSNMWADDRYWLPLLLQGKRFKGKFEFDDENTILRHTLTEL